MVNFMRNFSIISISLAGTILILLFLKELGMNMGMKRIKQKIQNKVRRKMSGKSWYRIIKCKIKKLLSSDVRTVLNVTLLVIATRLMIYLIGFMGVLLIRNENITLFGSFQYIWTKWDTPHYLDIAGNGYTATGEQRYLIVFYPLYPILVRLVNHIVGNYFYAGIVVSNFSLIVACFYLYKLTRLDYDKNIAKDTIGFLLIFPMSFFFGIVYTESLFIALTIMAFYYMRRRSWFLTGLCGMLASMTRNFGVLLLIPAGIEYLRASRLLVRIRGKRFIRALKHFFTNGIYILLIPVGILYYLYINKMVTGDWFTFLEYQRQHWHNRFGFFADNIQNHVINAMTWEANSRISLWIPQIASFVVAILLLYYAFGKLRLSYTAYMLTYIVIAFSPTWLLSGPRYIAGLFPIYITMALASKNHTIKYFITVSSALLLCFYTIAFATGYQVM